MSAQKTSLVLADEMEERFLDFAAMKPGRLNPLIEECSGLMNIIGKSIVTAKSNAPARKPR